MYPIVRIRADAPEATEPLGTKDKFWYGGGQYLFKQVRPNTGEDWSEKIAAELAGSLGLPHADYDLAEWNTEDQSVYGVRSRNFYPPGTALVLGTNCWWKLTQNMLLESFPSIEFRHTLSSAS